MKQPKKAISLFAGIEGFGLAIHKMGWEVVASVEWEQFPQLVIKKNFPKTEIHGDIKEFDGTKFRGTIDIVCGGFPCQPYSLAGKRQGKNDNRHLWPEMLRVIREVQPTWVIGENVPGLVNWSKGVVFEEVQSDLEAEGYEVQSFILPAAGVGAPHRRDRVWIVAYSNKCTTRPSRTGGETESYRSYNNDEQGCRGEQTEQHNGYGNVCGVNTDTGLFGQAERQKQTMGIEQLCKKRIIAYSAVHGHELRRFGEDRFAKGKGESEKYKRERVRDDGRGTREQGVTSNTSSQGREVRQQNTGQSNSPENGKRMELWDKRPCDNGNATHPRRPGQQKQNISTEPTEQGFNPRGYNAPGADWQNFPTQPPVCNGDDGIPADLVRYILRTGGDCYTEEEAEKEAKRIISKVRAEGIKAGGNAIVHQIALQIFKSINEFEKISTL